MDESTVNVAPDVAVPALSNETMTSLAQPTVDTKLADDMDIEPTDMSTTVVTDIKENNDMNTNTEEDIDMKIESALYRITAGLPRRELRLIVQEANDCEALLLEDIRLLEEALSNCDNATSSANSTNVDGNDTKRSAIDDPLNTILESPLTPLDRFSTASALLGRLRNDIALPSTLSVKNDTEDINQTISTSIEEEKALEELTNTSSPLYMIYTKNIIPPDTLLTLWKKISMNRAAFVFKRPVKIEEAPGYTDRILYPMDLSLIRKRILANNIQTYADFHNALALISHNCVKYNGRDTDYGRVARDFETMVDLVILQAVRDAASNPENPSEAENGPPIPVSTSEIDQQTSPNTDDSKNVGTERTTDNTTPKVGETTSTEIKTTIDNLHQTSAKNGSDDMQM